MVTALLGYIDLACALYEQQCLIMSGEDDLVVSLQKHSNTMRTKAIVHTLD